MQAGAQGAGAGGEGGGGAPSPRGPYKKIQRSTASSPAADTRHGKQLQLRRTLGGLSVRKWEPFRVFLVPVPDKHNVTILLLINTIWPRARAAYASSMLITSPTAQPGVDIIR